MSDLSGLMGSNQKGNYKTLNMYPKFSVLLERWISEYRHNYRDENIRMKKV
jgi:hypothetical protein